MWANKREAAVIWQYAVSAALFLSLLSCAVGPNFVRPKPPAVEHYTDGIDPTATEDAQGVSQHFIPGAKLGAGWWHLFQSPKIDVIVAQALQNNLTLEAAQASLRQSQDALRSGYGIFFPQAEADASATRQRFSPLKF